MSKLSGMFVKQKYQIEREMSVGPNSTRIWIKQQDLGIMIDFTPEQSLLLSVGDYKGWKNALARARKICTEFMGAEPICRYDAKPSVVWTHFMEWNLIDPEARLRVLVNRGEELAQIPFRNLVLLGDYCISDFEDKTLKQAYADVAVKRKQSLGVYGEDPGECDAVRVAKSSEFELFLEYTLLENIRIDQARYQDAVRPVDDLFCLLMHNATVSQIQDQQTTLALDYVLAAICRKVGIAILEDPSAEHRLKVDEDQFVKWFNYNSAHLTTICPDDASLSKVVKAYQLGKDVSAYAPSGDWRQS